MLLTIIYIIAITAEAMTGALSAGRRSMDWFGVVLIACVTALGGGSVRDVLLGHYPLTWVKHPEYLVLTCCAAFVTIIIAKWMKHLHSIFLAQAKRNAGKKRWMLLCKIDQSCTWLVLRKGVWHEK